MCTTAAVGLLELDVRRLERLQEQATAVARGTVVEDGIGKEDDIRVRWTGADGVARVELFPVYDVERYRTGAPFDVRYDPDRPDAGGFAADPEETVLVDDREVPQVLTSATAGGFLVAWAYRGAVYRRRLRQPAREVRVQVREGRYENGPPIPPGRSVTFVRLVDEEPGYQRVMWDPAVERVGSGRLTAQVRGPVGRRRAVVVTLPRGPALVPVGMRRHEPNHWFVLRRPTVRRPAASTDRSTDEAAIASRLRRAWPLLAASAMAGLLGWLIVTSPLGVAAFAVGGFGIAVNGRAFAGVRP